MSFSEISNINDIYSELKKLRSSVGSIIQSKQSEFQIDLAYVLDHDEYYSNYTLSLQKEGIIIKDAILIFEPSYYDMNGYPEVGDYVKILHQNKSFNIYILSRCNTPSKVMVGDNNNGIAIGTMMP